MSTAIIIHTPGDEYPWGVSTNGPNPPPEDFCGFQSREAAEELAGVINDEGLSMDDAFARLWGES